MRKLAIAVAVAALAAGLRPGWSLAAVGAPTPDGPTVTKGTRQVVERLQFTGRRSVAELAAGAAPADPSTGQTTPSERAGSEPEGRSGNTAVGRTAPDPLALPNPPAVELTSAAPGFSGFAGLRAADTLFAAGD